MANKKHTVDRREFFALSAGSVLALGLKSVSQQGKSGSLSRGIEQRGAKSSLIERPLGKTGIRLPIVSMGVMNAYQPDLVRRAIEKGVRHLDTAFAYGDGANEAMIGNLVAEMKVREKLLIATKELTPYQRRGLSGKSFKETLIRMTEDSLKRLKSDYIDILYLHDVSRPEEVRDPGFQEAIAVLKSQGKIRFGGFSTHSGMEACIEEAVRLGFPDVILTSVNYALAGNTKYFQLLKKAAEKGIGLIAMKTQCAQYWYRNMVSRDQQKFYEGVMVHRALLKWVLRHSFITTAIPGMTTFEQLEDDFSVAYDLQFTPEEIQFFKDRGIDVSLGYCTQCGECEKDCPSGIAIPSLMRVHMYLACYGNLKQARSTLEDISFRKGLANCQCSTCYVQCAKGVPVRERIDELRLLFA